MAPQAGRVSCNLAVLVRVVGVGYDDSDEAVGPK